MKSIKITILNKKLSAVTLPEMLTVLAIMGVLLLLALPVLLPLISKAKATEAQLQLKHVHMLQTNYFYVHSKYCEDLGKIGFQHEKMISDDGTANYQIEIVKADMTGFIARATAVVDFDGDGEFNVWEIDQDKRLEEIKPD